MSPMKEVWIAYRSESEGWWAESAEMPGWTAAGDSFEEVRTLAQEGVREFAGEDVLIHEEVPSKSQNTGALLFREVVSTGNSSHKGGISFGVTAYIVPQWRRQLQRNTQKDVEPDESLPLLPQVVRSR